VTQNFDVYQNCSLGKCTKIQLVSKGQIVFGDLTDVKFNSLRENSTLGFFEHRQCTFRTV
jgi:hypothetical protein